MVAERRLEVDANFMFKGMFRKQLLDQQESLKKSWGLDIQFTETKKWFSSYFDITVKGSAEYIDTFITATKLVVEIYN